MATEHKDQGPAKHAPKQADKSGAEHSGKAAAGQHDAQGQDHARAVGGHAGKTDHAGEHAGRSTTHEAGGHDARGQDAKARDAKGQPGGPSSHDSTRPVHESK